ncbi:Transport and Golgi organization protein 2 [Coemansia sp. RSA 2607]|nr:Transport and Golgi organization protein 2 [Coemansia sp. RSA 2607]
MCTTFWTTTPGHGYSLVVCFNRDEYFARPTLGFHHWDNTSIHAPLDQQPVVPTHRGSWLGLSTCGRLAMLTNFREPHFHQDKMISRGALVRDFLLSRAHTPGRNTPAQSAQQYAEAVHEEREMYDGFNFVAFDMDAKKSRAFYVSNRGAQEGAREVVGLQGLSNSTIDEPWPKVVRGKQTVADVLANEAETLDADALAYRLMDVMRDAETAEAQPQRIDDLKRCIFVPPVDGLGGDIAPGAYGTRSTTVVLLRDGHLTVGERTFGANGETPDTRLFHMKLDPR